MQTVTRQVGTWLSWRKLEEVRPGVWRSRGPVGYADNGAPKQHTETYKTGKREADKPRGHLASAGAGAISTATDTFGAYLQRWLDQRAGTWKATTERRNRTIVRELPEKLSAIKLRDRKRGDIQQYIDGLSPAGARRVHAVDRGALSDAVHGQREGLASNPAAGSGCHGPPCRKPHLPKTMSYGRYWVQLA